MEILRRFVPEKGLFADLACGTGVSSLAALRLNMECVMNDCDTALVQAAKIRIDIYDYWLDRMCRENSIDRSTIDRLPQEPFAGLNGVSKIQLFCRNCRCQCSSCLLTYQYHFSTGMMYCKSDYTYGEVGEAAWEADADDETDFINHVIKKEAASNKKTIQPYAPDA